MTVRSSRSPSADIALDLLAGGFAEITAPITFSGVFDRPHRQAFGRVAQAFDQAP